MKVPNPPLREPISGLLSIPWLSYFTNLTTLLTSLPKSKELLPNFVNDAAAAAGGVGLYEYYRNGSIVMQRVA